MNLMSSGSFGTAPVNHISSVLFREHYHKPQHNLRQPFRNLFLLEFLLVFVLECWQNRCWAPESLKSKLAVVDSLRVNGTEGGDVSQ